MKAASHASIPRRKTQLQNLAHQQVGFFAGFHILLQIPAETHGVIPGTLITEMNQTKKSRQLLTRKFVCAQNAEVCFHVNPQRKDQSAKEQRPKHFAAGLYPSGNKLAIRIWQVLKRHFVYVPQDLN